MTHIRHRIFRFAFFPLLVTAVAFGLLPQKTIAYTPRSVDGYDLISVVNSYRLSQGLYELNPEGHVMSAAQAHADWIVETGNGGHTGEGGSDETIRVGWTGYGGGANIHCDEAWASGTDDVSAVVYESWADWVHQGVMLDYWGNGYTDVGAGVSKDSDGRYVYVLDVCMVEGKPSPNRPTAVDTPSDGEPAVIVTPDEDATYVFVPLLTSTPAADGSVIHVVGEGQALVQIALSYGVKVAEIRKLNGMAEDWTLIYPGEKLVIVPKNSSGQKSISVTGTLTPDGTETATSTPAATQTPRRKLATLVLPTNSDEVPTSAPKPPDIVPRSNGMNQTGVILVAVSVVGLLGLLGWSIWGKK